MLSSILAFSHLKKPIPSGGSTTFSDAGSPCEPHPSAITPPKFPIPLPPYSRVSLLITSIQNPRAAPTLGICTAAQA
jgi:hypothetical protein